MGWIYLAVSINGAAYTLSAYRPARRSRLLHGWSFFASWVTIELAPFHLIWQVVATALFASRGALRTRPGKLGLAVTLASWAGLAYSIRQSYSARHEIREALRELGHEATERELLPVRIRRNIVFGRAGGRALRLDVHEPATPPAAGERRPALVQIHGGGWVIGFKDRQGQLLMRRLAERGWVCFNVDYRLSPLATFPDHLIDVKRALAWVRAHADEYGIDPGFVAVTGGSAGGHLTALTALTANDPRYQPGFEDADTSVAAAVPFYGVYDFTNRNGAWPPEVIPEFLAPVVMKCDPDENPELWSAASPLDQVHPGAPPFFVIHGDLDILTPVEDARDFVQRLRAVSKEPVYFLELHGAQHGFETFASIRANAVVEAAERFLDAVRSAYERAGQEVPSAAQVDAAIAEELGADATDVVR
ncbi:MAG: alpha/beta hydrolase [Acidimicrobiales bacterium]|jgi:acetyl esterase/lipase|nr:alpha/beta hydrolase [Acidimicrobiales bacterium]